MNDLNHKTPLVTGGSKGLGRGIVEALAGVGVSVWALARDISALDQLQGVSLPQPSLQAKEPIQNIEYGLS